jgi:hypothetical protein
MAVTRMMLGRRPDPSASAPQSAFGHVALNAAAQLEIEAVVQEVAQRALNARPIAYDPDDTPQVGEVMKHALAGIDNEFQPAAPWSLERAVKQIRAQGRPTVVDSRELTEGRWTFYVLRADFRGQVATVIRATSPTRSLKPTSRTLARFVGGELKPVREPLVGVDHDADAVVLDGTVYIFKPQRIERLFIDADEIKSRAPQIVRKFSGLLQAQLSSTAETWIEKACSENSIVGRRVERLSRTGDLSTVTVSLLRDGLKDAKLARGDFGTRRDEISIGSQDHAIALVDIAADLYYQPRFEKNSRKVASFRRL